MAPGRGVSGAPAKLFPESLIEALDSLLSFQT